MTAWTVFVAIGIGTYGLRASMFVLLGDRSLPAWTATPLAIVAPAAIAALVASMTFTHGGHAEFTSTAELVAVAGAFVLTRRTGNVMHAIAAGLPLVLVGHMGAQLTSHTGPPGNMRRVVYRFGSVIVDDVSREVRVDGERRPAEPQVVAVLAHLIQQRHRVVSKDELMEQVWGTPFVSASAVTSRIKSARQAIGDTGRAQSMIRTVHGRGYRFVAELEAGPAASQPHADVTTSAGPTHVSTRRPPVRTLDEGWPLVGRNRERDRAIEAALRRGRGSLLLTGPAGLGKTRLARAVIEGAAAEGAQVARIHGHPGAATVPLAALAHLLPPDVTEIAGVQGEMARTVLLQRARLAIRALGGDDRLVLMVDDVDRVDALSQTLLASLIADHTVFAVMTQRVGGHEALAMDHLIRSGDIDHVALTPIPDDQMIALIGRVLDGPVQPMTSNALVSASAGVPGVLRQLIEAALSNSTLTIRDGVWRLTGGLTPPGDMAAAVHRRLDHLDDDQRDALELLAIAGDLELDLAFDLIADEVLDRLELDGMISVREVGPSARLRLSHPLYAEILLDAITPLRDRRQRALLASALAEHASANAADRLQLVRLHLDSGTEVDSELLIESAALALIESDTRLALRLLRSVPDDRRNARHQQLLGEVFYMRGRFDDAQHVWQAMDLDELDDETAAGVVRRMATWSFYGKWRYVETIDRLDRQMQRFDGTARMSLESYWTELAAIDGNRVDEAIERAERLIPESSDHALADFLAGAAMAHFVRGRFHRSLGLIEACNAHSVDLERTIHWTSSAYGNFVEILTHLELGNLTDAWATFDRISEPGAAPDFGFASIAAGRLALASGRWQQALDWLEPKIQITEALGITTNGRPLQATAALAALMLDRHDTAAEMAEAMRSDLPDAINVTTLDIRWSVEQVAAVLGDPSAAVTALLDAANGARASQLHYLESLLLGAAVFHGGAEQAVERLAELNGFVEGDLVRLRHASALAVLGRREPDGVLAELDERGFVFESTSLRRALDR